MKRKMFLGASTNIFENARTLRENPTNAEAILWSYLRQKPYGFKFRRQHPIDMYIADFYCHAVKISIEVDGGIHEDADVKKNDIERQKYLESTGILFIRFKNEEIEGNISSVKEKIEAFIQNSIFNRNG